MLQWLKVFKLQCNNAEFTKSFLTHCPWLPFCRESVWLGEHCPMLQFPHM